MSDEQDKDLEGHCETDRMEVKVIGHAAPLRYPSLETVIARTTANAPETKKPPHGFGYPVKQKLHRSAVVPSDAGVRTMSALTDALEEIMIELGGGIHA